MNPITVLLADDHQVVREGFSKLLTDEVGIQVVAEAQTGRQAVALAAKLRPHVVVMDIAMPHLNGLEATRQILKAAPGVKVLILSAHGDDGYVEQALANGAAGYLIKQTSAHDLVRAIWEVRLGKTFLSPTIARRLPASGRPPRPRVARLTSRELEVLQLIAEGQPNKQVADELNISIKTVEKHRQSLMSKLNIHDLAGLTRYAIAAGIIESSVQPTVVPGGAKR